MRRLFAMGLVLVVALAGGCSGERSKEPEPVHRSMKARLPDGKSAAKP